ncbi:MAG: lysylphosphatidylglycerol synthase transmembrane domain-containing protein [Aggregatilineales bacterium]
MKRWQSLALGMIVSVVTLAYALHGVSLDGLWSEFAHARYIYLIPSLGLVIVGLALRALRWHGLLDKRTTLTHSFHILNVGYFFGALLPFRLGDVARLYLAARLTPPIALLTTLSTIVVERLTDTLAIVVMVALAVSTAPVPPTVATAAVLSGVAAIGGLIVLTVLATRRTVAHRLFNLFIGRIRILARLHPERLLDRLLDGITPIGSVRGLGTTLGWTTLAWAVSIAEGFVLMAMFYDQPDLRSTLLMMAMGALAVALPAVPGNVGPFEAAVIAGLTFGGLLHSDSPNAHAQALAFAVTVHVVNTGMFAFLGWIGLVQERVSLRDLIRSAQTLTKRDRPSSIETPIVITSPAVETPDALLTPH